MVNSSALNPRVMKHNGERIQGIIPVMLTPFHDDGSIDYEGLDRLTDWYLANGADALFAVCQSSEMQFLSIQEKVGIAKRVVSRVAGRVPIMASGHTAARPTEQLEELLAMAATGIDALVLVTNRMDPDDAGEHTFRTRLDWLLDRLPAAMPLGLYECPAPFRRLLTDSEVAAAAKSGRFIVLKDVSCELDVVARRVQLSRDTPLSIVNANAAIALDAMRVGSEGFCGVFTNFHPDLYAWAYRNKNDRGIFATDLASFLALSSMAEAMGYPVLAKMHHQSLGTFKSARARVITYDIAERHWAVGTLLNTISSTADRFRRCIAEAESQ